MKPQLELSLVQRIPSRHPDHRQRRIRRANWWFDHMRQVVDRALDRGDRRLHPPQQIHLALIQNTQGH